MEDFSAVNMSVKGSLALAELIKGRIRSGNLAAGARLIEAKIAAETGATRTHIREALQRLAGEGLVVIEEFRGASVRRLSFAEVEQIFVIREALEGLAARLAAQATLQARERIAEIQRRMDEHHKCDDLSGFAVCNQVWHAAIVETALNPYISAFLERLWIPIFQLSFNRTYTSSIIARSNNQHRLVTEAIVAGRPEEAEIAMRLHVASGRPPREHVAVPVRKGRAGEKQRGSKNK